MKGLKAHKLIVLILLLGFISSCEKELSPQLTNNDPVFYLTGSLDGQPILLEAGNEDYFMYTQLRADTNGVESMGGLLLRDTLQKRSGFYLNFRDPDAPGSSHSTPMDSALAKGVHPNYHYTGETPDEFLHEVRLQMLDSSDVTTQQWDLVLNGFTNDRSVTTVFDEQDLLEWPVSLVTTTSSGCTAKVTHYIDLTETDNCQSRFTYTQSNINAIDCVIDPVGGISQVEWSDGSGVYTGGTNMVFTSLPPGLHTICATIDFTNGCRHTVCRDVEIDPSGYVVDGGCQNDFVFDRQPLMVYDSLQNGTAELTYYDDQGVAYSTYYAITPGDIEVLESTPYDDDAWGRPTRAIRFTYSGELRSKGGNSIQVDQLTGTLAVAELP